MYENVTTSTFTTEIKSLEGSFIGEIRIRAVTAITPSYSAEEISGEQIDILDAADDAFGGVVVEMKKPINANVFDTSLRKSISHWREQVLNYRAKTLMLCLVGKNGMERVKIFETNRDRKKVLKKN